MRRIIDYGFMTSDKINVHMHEFHNSRIRRMSDHDHTMKRVTNHRLIISMISAASMYQVMRKKILQVHCFDIIIGTACVHKT